MAQRVLDDKLFSDVLAYGSPLEHAQRAVAKYREIVTDCPSWDWPRVCLRFAEQTLVFVQSSEVNGEAELEACDRFEGEIEGIKGILELWFLHDWLLKQVGKVEN